MWKKKRALWKEEWEKKEIVNEDASCQNHNPVKYEY